MVSSGTVLMAGPPVHGYFTESYTSPGWQASSSLMLPWDLSIVNMDGLKKLAQKVLDGDSALRMLILSEPDELPRIAALAKIDVYIKLLYREIGGQS